MMEAFIKLRKVIPCSYRYATIKFASITNKGTPTEDGAQEDQLPFSREGDSGFSVVNNIPLPKNDCALNAVGNTDELMCHLGGTDCVGARVPKYPPEYLCECEAPKHKWDCHEIHIFKQEECEIVARENAITGKHPYIDKLTRIQTLLVDIIIAINKQNSTIEFPPRHTKELEEWILQYSKELPPAENYLLPGGGKVSTSLHVARSVCRRAERSVFPLVKDGHVDKEIQVYLNRLADLLFTWARYAAKRDERSESVYTPKIEPKKQPLETKQESKESESSDCCTTDRQTK